MIKVKIYAQVHKYKIFAYILDILYTEIDIEVCSTEILYELFIFRIQITL